MINRRDVLVGALAALVAGLAYAPALWTDFTADDYFILARVREYGGLGNPLAYFGFGFFDYYRPLGFLSHALDWEIWGLDATGFHLTSVLLHAANTALVFTLARRVAGTGTAALAAMLFGLRAGGHETVYWAAARFDLLATFFTLLALVALTRDGRARYLAGLAAFACALLSKESAAALPLMVAAWDAFVARRPASDVVRRVVPLLAMGAAYAVLRSYGAGLAADGGRLPKVVLLAAGLAVLVLVSRIGAARARQAIRDVRLPAPWLWLGATAVALVALVVLPATSRFVLEKLGFVAYVGWVLGSPMAFPVPSVWAFVPASAAQAAPGLLVALVVLALAWAGRRWLAASDARLFALCMAAAAILPVLSMTGGPRYLYLAAAGAAILAALMLEALAVRRRMLATAIVSAWLVVSVVQLAEAASAWRWAGELSRQGLAVMSSEAPGCEDRFVVMVTAPVGLRGVYPNLLWDGLAVRSSCPPADIATLLRVVDIDATIEATRPSPGIIELFVPDYGGQFVASRDLRRYDVPLQAGATTTVETPLGRIESRPDAGRQHIRITLTPQATSADYFVYGAGRVSALGAAR